MDGEELSTDFLGFVEIKHQLQLGLFNDVFSQAQLLAISNKYGFVIIASQDEVIFIPSKDLFNLLENKKKFRRCCICFF